jgi:hypothetical protein
VSGKGISTLTNQASGSVYDWYTTSSNRASTHCKRANYPALLQFIMVKPIPPQEIKDKWPPPNFVDPERRSPALLLGITLTMTLLTIIVVGLRTYVRFIALRAPGWDDYAIFVSTVRMITQSSRNILTKVRLEPLDFA